jgi:isoleucyl-tRNA synthetase
MFKLFYDKISYSDIEKSILNFWENNNIFSKSVSSRPDSKPFTFYEGPPTANGRPGIHHVMARTLKDLVCRYKTLKGYKVNRKAGWDTHGLPVEIEVEKSLGLINKKEVFEFGIQKFNDECRKSVFIYKDVWEEMTRRMGYWVDLSDPYITCDNKYIESVWWSLKTLFDRGLIYKGYKVVPQDPKSETPLSSHELALGYRETQDPSIYVVIKAKDNQPICDGKTTYFLVWTTTPWTLISNVALAVGPNIDYVKIKLRDEYLILAKSRLSVINGDYEIVQEFKGKNLEYMEYEQLFTYIKPNKKAFYVILGDFVGEEDGSGIVHIAPAFGADDYEVSLKYDLPMLQPVTPGGLFTSEIKDFAGQFVKDADKGIIQKLKEMGRLFKRETITHTYPFCWRYDDVPVIYYARHSWFIKTTAFADRMVELNKTINWKPPEVGEGRFGNWLEENKDWNLSRDRFWATPLPIWISEEGDDMFAIGSIEELKKGFVIKDGKRISVADLPEIDLHKPFVDEILFEKNGKIYRRTPELIDVWYDSGAMPFAQFHYPFENKELFEKSFPADFICEGIDQTRGWFYTLHAIATLLFDKPAYKNVVVNELILDKKGQKMSKSRGNTVDPFDLFEKYGADATRWYLVTTSPPWKPTLFDEDGVLETQRKFFGTLTNTYQFFAIYANIDGFKHQELLIPYEERPELDRWIISKTNLVVREVEKLMDEYEITKAVRLIQDYVIDHLSNWYVRRSRRRFWKSEMSKNKLSAYQTLYECLIKTVKIASPFAPFICDYIYKNLNDLTRLESWESVHLSYYPEANYIDAQLEEKMDIAQRIVYLARSIRAKSNLKVRQPLRKILVALDDKYKDAVEKMKDVILEEVNIKELVLLDDDAEIVNKFAKPNFKSIGPKFGKNAKLVAEEIKKFDKSKIKELEKNKEISIIVNNEHLKILFDDVEILSSEIEGWAVESDKGITVALDKELTEELIFEGLAREFVNRVQNIRKDSGLDVTDRINIYYDADEKVRLAVEKFRDYISNETLANDILHSNNNISEYFDIDGLKCSIGIKKIDK